MNIDNTKMLALIDAEYRNARSGSAEEAAAAVAYVLAHRNGANAETIMETLNGLSTPMAYDRLADKIRKLADVTPDAVLAKAEAWFDANDWLSHKEAVGSHMKYVIRSNKNYIDLDDIKRILRANIIACRRAGLDSMKDAYQEFLDEVEGNIADDERPF